MTQGHSSQRWVMTAGLVLAATSTAAQQRPPIVALLPRVCSHVLTQDFPTSGPVQTTWRICWREVAGSNSLADPNGLVIGPVFFRKAPSGSFILVVGDMRVSDYFVPYHPGWPRYYDLSWYNFKLTGVTVADCPANVGGALLSPHVCKEVRDRGLMWKDFGGVRRGEEVVLWGAIDAANYRYIQEYTFRDDGTIVGRMGATAQNLQASRSNRMFTTRSGGSISISTAQPTTRHGCNMSKIRQASPQPIRRRQLPPPKASLGLRELTMLSKSPTLRSKTREAIYQPTTWSRWSPAGD